MSNAFIWIGFIISLALIVFVAIKNLWLGLFLGALTLGLFNLSFKGLIQVTVSTLIDPSIVLLALSVAIIPIIGGVMEESHLMESLVQNLRVGKKGILMLPPALFGMLPMPGGALLSAPVVERTGKGVKNETKAGINVWFRHLLIFIYPLGSLLPTTKMAGLNLYREILYILPFFCVIFIMGLFFLIRGVSGSIDYKKGFDLKDLLIPLGIILIAPIVHLSFMRVFRISEIPLIIGVSLSLIVALKTSRLRVKEIFQIAKKMKIWNFALIIFGMFLFLNIFKASNISSVIADIAFSKTFLLVGIGAFLGFATGRVQVPVSIIIPIYFAKYGLDAISPEAFAIMFFASFMGYIISPIHPCVLISIEFFNTTLKDFMKKMITPAVLCLIIAAIVGVIIL
ncbi:MAG: DUF401 family protein [candidate division WOR-3 bacterium]|nr:DUF401 family protein [candidate division WOR-3 bacterium]